MVAFAGGAGITRVKAFAREDVGSAVHNFKCAANNVFASVAKAKVIEKKVVGKSREWQALPANGQWCSSSGKGCRGSGSVSGGSGSVGGSRSSGSVGVENIKIVL